MIKWIALIAITLLLCAWTHGGSFPNLLDNSDVILTTTFGNLTG